MLNSRKIRFVAGGVGALMLLGAGTGVAMGSGSRQARWVTVQEAWVLDALTEAEIAIRPDGTAITDEAELPPPGSMFFFQDEIYKAADAGTARGARIGTSYGQCTVGSAAALCEVHAHLTMRGTIEFSFAFSFADMGAPPQPGTALHAAITGGTHTFAGISGEARVYEDNDEATDDRLELDAVIPRRR